MNSLHLSKDYTDEAILTKHKERVAATLVDLGYDPTDTIKLSLHPLELQGVQEAMRRDYCVQMALTTNNQKVLKQLLSP